MLKTLLCIFAASSAIAISGANLKAATVPVTSIDATLPDTELISFVAGGVTYTQSDLIQPSLTAFSGWETGYGIVVGFGETLPDAGSRSQLVTHDFFLDTGMYRIDASTFAFAPSLINRPGPDFVMFVATDRLPLPGVTMNANSQAVDYDGDLFVPLYFPLTSEIFGADSGTAETISGLENGSFGSDSRPALFQAVGIAIDLDDFGVGPFDTITSVNFDVPQGGFLWPMLVMGINSAVPEPSGLALLLFGGLSAVFFQRRRKIATNSAIASSLILVAICYAPVTHADTFGSGRRVFDIEFVTIGDPGNPEATDGPYPGFGYPAHPVGKVDYTYRMGKFEISERMINVANRLGGLGITYSRRGVNKPATNVNWIEALHFINWLNTSTGSPPAYKFDGVGNFQTWDSDDPGYNPDNLYRNSLANYVLPSVDEWFKAAFYDPTGGAYFDYATGSDTIPTPVASGTAADTAVYAVSDGPADITQAGGLSPYGTMGQGGNVEEWGETNNSLNYLIWEHRWIHGRSWESQTTPGSLTSQNGADMPANWYDLGFRVASVSEANIPEPSTVLLGAMAAVGLLMRRRALSD